MREMRGKGEEEREGEKVRGEERRERRRGGEGRGEKKM